MEIDSFWCQNGFQVHIFSVRDFVGKVKDLFYNFSFILRYLLKTHVRKDFFYYYIDIVLRDIVLYCSSVMVRNFS